MFRWYTNAVICYVYLSDVQWCLDRKAIEARLSTSRWFTRGWTLQELIAPSNVVFYSMEWREIGTKSHLCGQISTITGIDEHILNGSDLEDVCVAKKMSWASRRKTSRTEDIAYCLLGIFDVNMPLIYGEGRKAFLRLQQEIMRSTTDQSLFAWGTMVTNLSDGSDGDQNLGLKSIEWIPLEKRQPLLGLLAESPEWFKSCGQYSRFHSSSYFLFQQKKVTAPTLVDKGVMIGLVLQETGDKFFAAHYWDRPRITQVRRQEIAILSCHSGSDERYAVGLPLRQWGDGSYARTQELAYIDLFNLGAIGRLFRDCLKTIHIKPPQRLELEDGDIIFRRYMCQFNNKSYAGKGVRHRTGHRVLQLKGRATDGIFALAVSNGDEACAFVLRRIPDATMRLGALCVGVMRVNMAEDGQTRNKDGPEWIKIDDALSTFPTYHRVMAIPSDAWALNVENLPRIFVKVQRMPQGDDSSSMVDVVDLVIPRNADTIARMVHGWSQSVELI
jgi:hypothetical protein